MSTIEPIIHWTRGFCLWSHSTQQLFLPGQHMRGAIVRGTVQKILGSKIQGIFWIFSAFSNSNNGRPSSATPRPSHCTWPWQTSSIHTEGLMPQLVLLPKWLSIHSEWAFSEAVNIHGGREKAYNLKERNSRATHQQSTKCFITRY